MNLNEHAETLALALSVRLLQNDKEVLLEYLRRVWGEGFDCGYQAGHDEATPE